MIITLLAVAVAANAGVVNCVPAFYRSLPRDASYYYGAGRGDTAAAARADAVHALASQAVVTDGWEQDDHGVCDGVYYALVRVEKEAAGKRKVSGKIETKLDEIAGGQRETNQRLAALADKPAQVIVVNSGAARPSPAVAFVSPLVSEKLALVDSGAYTREDIVMLVASYRTERDWTGLAKFCHKVLDPRFNLRGGPEFTRWVASKCLPDTER